MIPITVVALSQAGHPIRIQLPSRVTRAINVDVPFPKGACITHTLALRALILVDAIPESGITNQLFLYNGSLETQWLTHKDIIAYMPESP